MMVACGMFMCGIVVGVGLGLCGLWLLSDNGTVRDIIKTCIEPDGIEQEY